MTLIPGAPSVDHYEDGCAYVGCAHDGPVHEAFWTKAADDPIASLRAILTLATIVLAIFTALLWRSTRKAVGDAAASGERQGAEMVKSIAEAARAATAMEGVAQSMAINAEKIVETVEINKEIAVRQRVLGEAQLRAYLAVLVGGAIYQDAVWKFEARPVLTNTGHTPARNVRWRIRCEILPVPLPAEFRFTLPGHGEGSGFIPQHQSVDMRAWVDDRIPDADVLSVKLGTEKGLYVWESYYTRISSSALIALHLLSNLVGGKVALRMSMVKLPRIFKVYTYTSTIAETRRQPQAA